MTAWDTSRRPGPLRPPSGHIRTRYWRESDVLGWRVRVDKVREYELRRLLDEEGDEREPL